MAMMGLRPTAEPGVPDCLAPRILIVEDDAEIRQLVARYLRDNGFAVCEADRGLEMDRLLRTQAVDLVVLDVNLPDENGFDICLRLRQTRGPPIVMLTSRGEDVDRILGLELGADDYVSKPFNPRELLARIRAVLRRSASASDGPNTDRVTFAFDGYRLDTRRRQLSSADGARVVLTVSEYEVLRTLCESGGRILSREELRAGIAQSAHSTDRSIDIIVSRLRQKIERDPKDPVLVQTIRSLGYMFTPVVTRT